MTDQTSDLLSELLEGAMEQLDIPPELFNTIVGRYHHVAEWLAKHGDVDVEIEIYPQGSIRLGTPVRPEPPLNDFDIDMVFQLRIRKNDITKLELRDLVGDLLELYVTAQPAGADTPKLEERGRCFTLHYHELGFHLDVLPAIPDEENAPTGILLTDKDLHHWQYSNPIGYADWFLIERMPVKIRERATEGLAIRLGKSIEEVPRFLVRTPLQRAVQVAKRHRDVFFADDPTIKPPSILVTTLIAMSYEGETSLVSILARFLDRLPDLIINDNGTWRVSNPVADGENFADKWNANPERLEAFREWCDELRTDLRSARDARGLDRLAAVLERGLGEDVVKAATNRLGASFGSAAAVVGPAVASGHLTREVPAHRAPHTFHGTRRPRP